MTLSRNREATPPWCRSGAIFRRKRIQRTRGRHLANLRRNPGVAVLYFSRTRGTYLRLYGRAELHEGDAVREQIMGRVVEPELNYDPERRGIGVLIRVDRLVETFGGVAQQRDSPAGT